MMKMNLFVLLLLVALVHLCSSTTDKKSTHGTWDYGEHGPSTWGEHCGGENQSPINIVTCETSRATSVNRVFSHNYWKGAFGKYTIKNNGHALQIDLPANTTYELRKGHKKYIPLQVHIHFDPFTGKGSEHMLNSHKYFAEIHIVHRNIKYATKEQYMKHTDGLLVIGIFVDLKHKVKETFDRTTLAMRVFGKAARNLRNPGNKETITAFPLAWLLPKAARKNADLGYVNYKGSLTTPPCSEIVDWIVITGQTLVVNEKMAKYFEGVMNSAGTPMGGNNRPIQDLNERDVCGVKGII